MQPTFHLHDSRIYLGSLSDSFPEWFNGQGYSRVFILADEHTERFCLPVFLEKSGLAVKPTIALVKSGEDQKNLASCERIWQSMLLANLDRKALVINLGGGVIGDMGGFCAAAWKRGIDFIQVPTTLLAMTDASIGGKTGIDFYGLKNIIGVFRQPAAVFIDPDFLKTLPERELRSGFAEVIKHAVIGDHSLWRQFPESLKLSSHQWLELLNRSIAVKVRIVSEDPHETGIRMLLNFGHTIGHALESYFLETENPLTHGEAIAIGMICETVAGAQRDEIASCMLNYFPHRVIPEQAFHAIWTLMQQDKKNSSGNVRMALPDETPYSMKIIEPVQADIDGSLLYYNGLV